MVSVTDWELHLDVPVLLGVDYAVLKWPYGLLGVNSEMEQGPAAPVH